MMALKWLCLQLCFTLTLCTKPDHIFPTPDYKYIQILSRIFSALEHQNYFYNEEVYMILDGNETISPPILADQCEEDVLRIIEDLQLQEDYALRCKYFYVLMLNIPC